MGRRADASADEPPDGAPRGRLSDSPRISKREVAAELSRLAVPKMSLAAAGASNLAESSPQSRVVELNEAIRKAEKRAPEKARGNRCVPARLLGVSGHTR